MSISIQPTRRVFVQSTGLAVSGFLFVPASVRGPLAQDTAGKVDPSVQKFRASIGAAAIETTRLGDRMVMLSGPGGNIVVLSGSDGKIAVDSFVEPAWPRLKSTLDGLDSAPVKVLIDTHWHFDHVDNNAAFRAAGAEVIAHEATKQRMSESHEIPSLKLRFYPSPLEALPTRTFADTHTLRANGDQIVITHVPPAHTDTDVMVHFTNANVLHLGDLFFAGRYPFIDVSTRGTIDGMIAAAGRALKLVDASTKIVPGHGPLADRAMLERYGTMLTAVRDRVREQKAKGRTLAEVQAAKPTAEFDAEFGKGMPPNDFISLVYPML